MEKKTLEQWLQDTDYSYLNSTEYVPTIFALSVVLELIKFVTSFVFILIFILFKFPILQNIKINKFHIKQHHLNFLLYLHTIFIHEI